MSKSSELQFNISKHVSLEKSVKIDKIEKTPSTRDLAYLENRSVFFTLDFALSQKF